MIARAEAAGYSVGSLFSALQKSSSENNPKIELIKTRSVFKKDFSLPSLPNGFTANASVAIAPQSMPDAFVYSVSGSGAMRRDDEISANKGDVFYLTFASRLASAMIQRLQVNGATETVVSGGSVTQQDQTKVQGIAEGDWLIVTQKVVVDESGVISYSFIQQSGGTYCGLVIEKETAISVRIAGIEIASKQDLAQLSPSSQPNDYATKSELFEMNGWKKTTSDHANLVSCDLGPQPKFLDLEVNFPGEDPITPSRYVIEDFLSEFSYDTYYGKFRRMFDFDLSPTRKVRIMVLRTVTLEDGSDIPRFSNGYKLTDYLAAQPTINLTGKFGVVVMGLPDFNNFGFVRFIGVPFAASYEPPS
jgi:hypothetical protein